MHKPIYVGCLFLLLFSVATNSHAQTMPVVVEQQDGTLVFATQSQSISMRAALYNLQGILLADSGPEARQRWAVPVKVEPGVYLGVFWLREQGGAMKRLVRIEVRATTVSLQAAEEYLRVVESLEYQTDERRAYDWSVAALPFFRAATKALPEDSVPYVFLIQAIQGKYGRFRDELLAPPPIPPPPPPPVPPAIRSKPAKKPATRKTAGPKLMGMIPPPPQQKPNQIELPQAPTAEEKQEMLAACQKAVAVAKTCADKTEALRWLAVIQAELNQETEQLATLEQIAQASCATNEIKANSWYRIGVHHWDCAYRLTRRYAHPKQEQLDPFHFRKLTKPADQQQFEHCWQSGMQAVAKALTYNAEFAEAMFYQSLLYREQQKTAPLPTERAAAQAQAEQLAQQAIALMQKQRGR
ncbi:MAG TPA: hypothetical protein VFZ34_05660 [Blastocatellia bacterium]|nr:hypothetical protein [Blastocatellia bacterium]